MSVAQQQRPHTPDPGLEPNVGLLLRRYARGGDRVDRDAIVERYLPLARRLALRYRHSGEPIDDLVQVASLGLLKAVERFDPDRELAFTSYAVPTILGELKRHMRDTTWAIHVPRGLQERAAVVMRATDALAGRLRRSPTPVEIAELTELDVEQVLEALEAREARNAASLQAERNREWDDDHVIDDTVGASDERFELIEDYQTVLPAMEALPDRDRRILRMRFEEDLTQSQIADRVGVSQMQVSRLLRRALERLRQAAEPERLQ